MRNGLIVLLVIFASLWGCRKRTVGEALSLEQGSCVKGLAALLLVLVHIGNSLSYPGFYSYLSSFGYLLVAVFFFYSGYGITKKSVSDPRYFTKRIPNRIIYLIKMVVVTEFIYYAVETIVMRKQFTAKEFLFALLGVNLLNGAMWYIVALIIIMLCHYFIVNSLHKSENLGGGYTVSAAISVTIYIIISVLRGRAPWEMQSCIAFVLGNAIAENEQKIMRILKKNSTAICNCVIFASSFVAPYIVRYFLRADFSGVRVLFGSIASVAFVCIVLVALSWCEIGNTFIKRIGKISTEIYLSHQLIILLYRFYLPTAFEKSSALMISLTVIITTILVSYLIYGVEKKIKQKVRKL